jgi:von Willebrand factor type A domain
MTKFMISILIILIAINTITAVEAEAQSTSSSPTSTAISVAGSAVSNNNVVKILGLDPTAFPKIKVNIFIDKFCAMAGNLKKEDFKVKENGKDVAIANLHFTGNASGQKLDLAVVFDDTGSMGEEISAMKSKVKGLTDTLKASGINANYALVSFKDSMSVKTNWTDDPEVFKKQVNSLQAQGGNDEPEVALDAIETVLSMGFRPGTQKVILVITDAHAHYKNDSSVFSNYTNEEIEKDLKGSGAIFIPISPTFNKPSNYVDLREVANDIQSMRIDINSADFSAILEQFQGMLTGTYVIEYASLDQTPAENRTVLVSVGAPGCVTGNNSSYYITPGSAIRPNNPPIIDDLTSVLTSPQDAGTIITWTANASDPDGDPVLYRFFLDDLPVTDWMTENTWIWTINEAGAYRIEVRVRDAKHAGPNGLDDRKSESFTITEPKTSAQANQLPIINDLVAVQDTGMDITWTANATDPENDPILYRFFFNNKTMTDWIEDNKWTLNASDANVGDNQVEVQVRDGKHAGSDGYDDAKSVQFKLSSMKLMVQKWMTILGTEDVSAHSVLQAKDGGYVIVGGYVPRAGEGAWMRKTDANGNKLWYKTFGGYCANEVQKTSDGGYIIAGTGFGSAWLIKTDADGNKLWDKTFGGSSSIASDEGNSVQQTKDGGYILAGYTSSFGLQDLHAWLIRTDASGNELWNKTYVGGPRMDLVNSVRQTTDGGYILCGSTATRNRGVWLIKTYPSGNVEWDRKLPGIGVRALVRQTNDGGYIISGGGGSTATDLIKTDSFGNEEWVKFSNLSFAYGLQQTSDGGYIITGGYSFNTTLLIKTDSAGNEEWSKPIGGYFDKGSIQQTNDGGYIVAVDNYLIKTDANGEMFDA